MGLLGDLYSTIDSKKRQLRGLLSDPLETLYQGVRNFGAEQQGLLDLQARAYPWTGTDRTAAPDLAARKALADAGAAQGMAAATVWHGSPHKFDKFDSSKIGTGEGAQAYGHGLYLAESPEVAKSYQSALSADRGFSYGGKTGLTRAEVQDMVNAKYGGGYLDGVIRPSGVADSFIDDMVTGTGRAEGAYPRQYKPGSQRAKIYDELRGQIQHADPGHLYKVDLPDDQIARMLDWDKPLSQQAPEVQAALANTKNKHLRAVVDYASSPYSTPGLESEVKTMGEAIKLLGMNQSPAKGSQMLAKQGIPGIRYLDGGSRGAGQGSSNFVVFPGNEGLLKIIERNGK